MHVDQWEKRLRLGAVGDRILRALAVPRVSRTINVTAIILFAAGLAHWTWKLVVPRSVSPAAILYKPAVPAAADLGFLLKAHLFGRSPHKDLAGIPVSHLALTVSGLVAGDPGMALIGAPGHPVKPYRVGDTITAGVVLEAVTGDRAIVRQAGTLQSLPLYVAHPAVAQASAPSEPTPRPAVAVSTTKTRSMVPMHVTVSSSSLHKLASAAPTQVGRWLKPGPAGGLVVKGAPGGLFKSLHLHAGDTIEEINGRPVNSLGAAMAAYAAGMKAGNLSLDVAHKGHIRVLRYTLP